MGLLSGLLTDLGGDRLAGAHEGWVEGFDVAGGRFAYPQQAAGHVADVRAACECGWRGAAAPAPAGTMWWPYIVELPTEGDYDRVMEAWQEHVAALAALLRPRIDTQVRQ